MEYSAIWQSWVRAWQQRTKSWDKQLVEAIAAINTTPINTELRSMLLDMVQKARTDIQVLTDTLADVQRINAMMGIRFQQDRDDEGGIKNEETRDSKY